MRDAAKEAVAELLANGEDVHVVPQIIVEFWVVCTRPVGDNGLGLSAAETDVEITKILSLMNLLPDTPKLFQVWRELVVRYSVIGKPAHDTRIAAAMIVHGIDNIITFNDGDFRRYSEITALTPKEVIAQLS